MKDVKLIYDFSKQPPPTGTLLLPVIFIALGITIFFYYKIEVDKKEITSSGLNRRKLGMFCSIVFAFIAGIFSRALTLSSNDAYNQAKKIYTEGRYQTVEGRVEQYHPMPPGGHDTERFTVQGVPFEYSDYSSSDYGYNNAASKGGAIKKDLFVRISYFNNGRKNVILRLETE